MGTHCVSTFSFSSYSFSSSFCLARGSMEAHAHTGGKVFKCGTLIVDDHLIRFTKFHVCT